MSVNGEVPDDGGEEATSGEIEERIEDFKQDKARQKIILYSDKEQIASRAGRTRLSKPK